MRGSMYNTAAYALKDRRSGFLQEWQQHTQNYKDKNNQAPKQKKNKNTVVSNSVF